jgi:hypothetical protein
MKEKIRSGEKKVSHPKYKKKANEKKIKIKKYIYIMIKANVSFSFSLLNHVDLNEKIYIRILK